MKPANNPFAEFIDFLIAVLKKPIFLLFLFVGVISFLLGYIFSEFSLLHTYHIIFVLIGFIWSSFLTYRDLSQAYQELANPAPVEMMARSELSISTVVGNEYAYLISDPYSGQNQYMTELQDAKGMECHFDERGIFFINDKVFYVMPHGELQINIRIHNSGDLPLDVLSMDTYDNLNLSHLRLFHVGVFHHGSRLQFPFRLECGELFVLQVKYGISINRGSHESLFAADFRALPRSISHEISFNTMDLDGEKRAYVSEIKTLSKPLVDMYVNQWREFDQEEYLVLAGYGSMDEAGSRHAS